MGLESYSTTATSNTALFPEGQAPSTLNDGMRTVQADLRSFMIDLMDGFLEYGDGAATVAYASSTSFTVAGVDVTAAYHAGRRVRAVGSSTGTIYGTISSSSFSTNTTVNVTWDSGSLSNESLTVTLGVPPVTGRPVPAGALALRPTRDQSLPYTLVQADAEHILNLTTGAGTLTVPSAATLGDGFVCYLIYDVSASSVTINNGVYPLDVPSRCANLL